MLICLFVGFVLFVFDITWGEKYQWIKIWGKMDNDIFLCIDVFIVDGGLVLSSRLNKVIENRE